jgi:hypothetical protein
MDARRMLSLVAAGALIAGPGCATDEAVEKASKNAEKTGDQAVDDVDDNDSK